MMSIYPGLDLPPEEMARAAREQPDPHAFRLQKISKLEAFLHSEIETHERLSKKYRTAVKVFNDLFGGLSAICTGMAASGMAMIPIGIGIVPGLTLGGVGIFLGSLEAISIVASRICGVKAAKHSTIQTLAMAKLDTIRSHVQKAMEDDLVNDDEYKLICEEVEKYRNRKEESRPRKLVGSGVVDDRIKKRVVNSTIVSRWIKITRFLDDQFL